MGTTIYQYMSVNLGYVKLLLVGDCITFEYLFPIIIS